jgi:hypothetical protein
LTLGVTQLINNAQICHLNAVLFALSAMPDVQRRLAAMDAETAWEVILKHELLGLGWRTTRLRELILRLAPPSAESTGGLPQYWLREENALYTWVAVFDVLKRCCPPLALLFGLSPDEHSPRLTDYDAARSLMLGEEVPHILVLSRDPAAVCLPIIRRAIPHGVVEYALVAEVIHIGTADEGHWLTRVMRPGQPGLSYVLDDTNEPQPWGPFALARSMFPITARLSWYQKWSDPRFAGDQRVGDRFLRREQLVQARDAAYAAAMAAGDANPRVHVRHCESRRLIASQALMDAAAALEANGRGDGDRSAAGEGGRR